MAEYATVTSISPLAIRPRGSSSSANAVKLAQVTGLAVNDQVTYDILDPSTNAKGKVSGVLLVLGKLG